MIKIIEKTLHNVNKFSLLFEQTLILIQSKHVFVLELKTNNHLGRPFFKLRILAKQWPDSI